MQDNVTIALAQFSPKMLDKKSNLEMAEHYISCASKKGADIILLPELFLSGYAVDKEFVKEMAEPFEGDNISKLKRLADSNSIAVYGGFLEYDQHNNKIYNSSAFISDRGDLVDSFRKIHLFTQEQKTLTPGNKSVIVEYKGIRYGLLICFDLEFPELARELAIRKAEVLLTISANMEPYGLQHRTFALARAMENHTFVAYCNQVGSNGSVNFSGESCIVSPTGQIICELTREEKMITGTAKLSDIFRSRIAYNYLDERKINICE